jgi:hypothetical protein
MADDPRCSSLRDAEGRELRFTFHDGEEMRAHVMSGSHVDADGTVIILRVGPSPIEHGESVKLEEIRSVEGICGPSLNKGG